MPVANHKSDRPSESSARDAEFRTGFRQAVENQMTGVAANDASEDRFKGKKRQKNLFGRADYAAFYDKVNEAARRHGILKLCRVEPLFEQPPQHSAEPRESQGSAIGTSVIICNLWRIDSIGDGDQRRIRLWEHDLQKAIWKEISLDKISTLGHEWPVIPILPARRTQSLSWWRDVVSTALSKLMRHEGWGNLPKPRLSKLMRLDRPGDLPKPATFEGDDSDFSASGETYTEKPPAVMTPYALERIIIQRYIGRPARTINWIRGTRANDQHQQQELVTSWQDRWEWLPGRLSPVLMSGAAKTLRKALFAHVLDRDLATAILLMEGGCMVNLTKYLDLTPHREALVRISRERRNLLPLLTMVDKTKWDRPDLFSKQNWVVQATPNSNDPQEPRQSSAFLLVRGNSTQPQFASKAAYRWISHAPITVVRTWVLKSAQADLIEAIAQANISTKVPAIVWRSIIDQASTSRGLNRMLSGSKSEKLAAQRLLNLLVIHHAQMWKERGFEALKTALKSTSHRLLTDISDWLIDEGLAQGLPERNATLESLIRRTAAWHRDLARARAQRILNDPAWRDRKWISPIGVTEISGITFTPLNTARQLVEEGIEQNHCAGTYIEHCASDKYRIFAVTEPEGTRSTLGLSRTSQGQWRIDQHRGSRNGSVSKAALQAGQRLLTRFNRSLGAKNRSKAPQDTQAATRAALDFNDGFENQAHQETEVQAHPDHDRQRH